ncbi:MAG: hypothetical protein HFJ37_01550 [Clostridia bacterium]|nr:hypothetical protein [Clostridia bacterium]
MIEKLNYNIKGITLISLAITMIILLILAGITMVALTGENGILSQATKAKEETRIGAIVEQWNLLKSEIIISKITNASLINKNQIASRLSSVGMTSDEINTLIIQEGSIALNDKTILNYSDLGFEISDETNPFRKLTFYNQVSVNSVNGTFVHGITGRASCLNQELKVKGGETIGLSSLANNVTYSIYEFNDNMVASGGQTHSSWFAHDITLNPNTRYLRITFKNGDGSIDFTDEQLLQLPSYLEFK